jgi:hypothetical protein
VIDNVRGNGRAVVSGVMAAQAPAGIAPYQCQHACGQCHRRSQRRSPLAIGHPPGATHPAIGQARAEERDRAAAA